MILHFQNYISKNKLFTKKDKLLLALSGGIDSMVLCNLLLQENYNFSAAHCNFNLRGNESNDDEQFVTNFCAKHNIKLYKISFQTKAYAEEKGISIQMAARELRYNWFEEIYEKHNFNYILSAHHAYDAVETFHINLARGTGIKGLSGIKAKTGHLVRPLLFASRKAITKYQQKNNLAYREDSSNSSTKYARNKIRHIVIPAMTEINKAYNQNVIQSIEHLHDIEKIYFNQVEIKRKEIVTEKDNIFYVNINKLINTVAPKTFLFEFIKEFGFNSEQTGQIYESIENQSGKEFFSEEFVLLKDRNRFIIRRKPNENKCFRQISENESDFNFLNKNFSVKKLEKTSNFKIERNPKIALLDLDKIKFPLELTNWQKGDYFYPLGMNKRKKLSDFFIDKKYSLIEKEKQLLLKSADEILWVVGKQLDNRFKITDNTKNILRIEVFQ